MNGNKTLRKLLSDDQCNGVLELYEKCEINSFLEIEKYYSGGIMELNDNNICDILRFSMYYNDSRIMILCKKYLKTHLNDVIMIELFDILYKMNVNNEILNDIQKISGEYLNKKDKLLLKMNLKCLKLLLNNGKLLINDETWLLNRLLKWYKLVLKESEENEKELNEFITVLKSKIHLNEIKIEKIEEENLSELKELNIEISEYINDHMCMNTDEIENVELVEIVNEYYIEDEEVELNDNQLKVLQKEEVKEEMVKLLSSKDIKLVEIILNLIIEMRMDEIIPSEIKNKLLREIICEYGETERNRTLKSLCIFIDNKKHITAIEHLCGKEILFKILNYEYYLNSKSKEILIKYIRKKKLSEKEEEEMSEIIKDEELLNELKDSYDSDYSPTSTSKTYSRKNSPKPSTSTNSDSYFNRVNSTTKHKTSYNSEYLYTYKRSSSAKENENPSHHIKENNSNPTLTTSTNTNKIPSSTNSKYCTSKPSPTTSGFTFKKPFSSSSSETSTQRLNSRFSSLSTPNNSFDDEY